MNTPAARILHAALLLPFLTAPLAAQWASAPRFVTSSNVSVERDDLFASPEREPERTAPAIRGQMFAGFVGLVVGTALGGTTYGVYRFSEAKGANGRALPTFGGAALGLLGGPPMWVTVPLGARWGYNRSRVTAFPSR